MISFRKLETDVVCLPGKMWISGGHNRISALPGSRYSTADTRKIHLLLCALLPVKSTLYVLPINLHKLVLINSKLLYIIQHIAKKTSESKVNIDKCERHIIEVFVKKLYNSPILLSITYGDFGEEGRDSHRRRRFW